MLFDWGVFMLLHKILVSFRHPLSCSSDIDGPPTAALKVCLLLFYQYLMQANPHLLFELRALWGILMSVSSPVVRMFALH